MKSSKNKSYPYCEYCDSCGVDDCCSPTKCLNNDKGIYCKYSQETLKISYWTLREFWNNLDNEKYPEIDKILNDIYQKNKEEFKKSLNT